MVRGRVTLPQGGYPGEYLELTRQVVFIIVQNIGIQHGFEANNSRKRICARSPAAAIRVVQAEDDDRMMDWVS